MIIHRDGCSFPPPLSSHSLAALVSLVSDAGRASVVPAARAPELQSLGWRHGNPESEELRVMWSAKRRLEWNWSFTSPRGARTHARTHAVHYDTFGLAYGPTRAAAAAAAVSVRSLGLYTGGGGGGGGGGGSVGQGVIQVARSNRHR